MVASEPAAPAKARRLAVTSYPNPFAGVATITLEVAEAGPVRVEVLDVLGRRVAVLHEGPLPAGEHRLTFDGNGLAPGVYVVHVTGDAPLAQRVTLVR